MQTNMHRFSLEFLGTDGLSVSLIPFSAPTVQLAFEIGHYSAEHAPTGAVRWRLSDGDEVVMLGTVPQLE